ncbi:hypothetical protein [Aliiglaciecola sp. LCG003]|uniref:hypothetical protein n=1 Tax=Aliiglaciecola sp. LCG003 TaxID=3053655 RepID=UPI0025732B54|nr:hypothetical protein [Aliiglaciecola sp. LCG003]WJG07661.1 hypothetical protein QR722_09790 [Aliiglaciecola sp. LCG003]
MKHLIDVHVVLATSQDMEYWEDHAEEAADRLNTILHLVYDLADEEINTQRLENIFQHVWENWCEDAYLLEIDDADLHDWVAHLLVSWEDEIAHDDHEQHNELVD